jgi:hypothetical protein
VAFTLCCLGLCRILGLLRSSRRTETDKVWGTDIPIALVGAPDAGRLREDRHGLSLKAARDPVAMAMSSRGRPAETANAG